MLHDEIIGSVFGNWSVIGPVIRNDGRYKVLCKCLCPKQTEKYVYVCHLKNGLSNGCGCYKTELPRKVKHGQYGTRTYESWCQIKKRCLNPNNNGYPNYGGRGITICDEWLEFENFYRDMGDCPDGMEIDRIGVNGNYCKENCRWATDKEQGRNKRSNIFIEWNGQRKCLSEWAEFIGLTPRIIYYRHKNNWRVEDILSPIKLTGKRYKGRDDNL